jgi:two-component system, chemotaxis family, protein-glutamate methylesterase/glutaminase
MPARDIIVIGASAGGVETLQRLICQLPGDLPAAVFVVMHLSARSRSLLPEILSRAGVLPVGHPDNGMPIENGRIYVAPPDHHLVVERDHIHLGVGPKEQHQRPCINVSLRSAALAYGDRVAGVILTGTLDDGTAGLWEVKRRGGVAVVQTPEEALFPSMPLSALREIEVDYTVGIADMAPLLTRLAAGETRPRRNGPEPTHMDPKITDLTCPDCRGTIWELPLGNGTEFRCRVGHTYSAKSMLAEHYATQEKALYAAVVALEEGASLTSRLADAARPEVGDQLRSEARDRETEAEALRKLLRDRRSFSLD